MCYKPCSVCYQFIQSRLAVVQAGFLHECLHALQSRVDEKRGEANGHNHW